MSLPVPSLREHPGNSAIAFLVGSAPEVAAAVLAAVDGLRANDLDALARVMSDHDPASVALTAVALLAMVIEPEPGP